MQHFNFIVTPGTDSLCSLPNPDEFKQVSQVSRIGLV